MIAHEGEATTQAWLTGLKPTWRETARKRPGTGEAIYEGVCDVAITNHYHGQNGDGDQKAGTTKMGEALGLCSPTKTDGQHLNLSGAGVLKNAKNRDNAIKMLEFLVSEKAQKMYAQDNFEYPVERALRCIRCSSLGGLLSLTR